MTDERRYPLVVSSISPDFSAIEHQNLVKILLRRASVTKAHGAREFPPPTCMRTNCATNTYPSLDPNVIEYVLHAQNLILLLDYDGTLVPFAATPENAAPDSSLIELLLSLSQKPRTCVNIISGRDAETLERWFGHLPIGLFAEHGLWARPRPNDSWRPLHPLFTDWKVCIEPLLERFTSQTPGASIEDKSGSIAWHYRLVDPHLAHLRVKEVQSCLDELAHHLPIDIVPGDKVLEVRMRGVNKGLVIASFFAELSDALILALGDDHTDEDLFAALPPKSIAVHIGKKPSLAPYRLRDFQDARRLLESLLPKPSEK